MIAHLLDPENKYPYHSFVESPDMKNIFEGTVRSDASSEAVVELPAYFEALNGDFRYPLTAIGAPGPNLQISRKIENNTFEIAGCDSAMEVSWMITGIRQDRHASENRMHVEVDKPMDKRGTLHPQATWRRDSSGPRLLLEDARLLWILALCFIVASCDSVDQPATDVATDSGYYLRSRTRRVALKSPTCIRTR